MDIMIEKEFTCMVVHLYKREILQTTLNFSAHKNAHLSYIYEEKLFDFICLNDLTTLIRPSLTLGLKSKTLNSENLGFNPQIVFLLQSL